MFLTGKERAQEEGKKGERKTEATTTESERDEWNSHGQIPKNVAQGACGPTGVTSMHYIALHTGKPSTDCLMTETLRKRNYKK